MTTTAEGCSSVKGTKVRIKYPSQTCRDCGHASWVWSAKLYPEGKKRIVVQEPGYCRATSESDPRAGSGAGRLNLDARAPFSDCIAWIADTRHQRAGPP